MKKNPNTILWILAISIFILIVLQIILFFISFGNPRGLFQQKKQVSITEATINRGYDYFTVLKVSHPYPLSHPVHIALSELFGPNVEKETNLGIIVEIYPANQLGSTFAQFEGVQKGTIEMHIASSSNLQYLSEMEPFSTPFRFPSSNSLFTYFQEEQNQQKIVSVFQDLGLFYGGWGYVGSSHIVKMNSSSALDTKVGITTNAKNLINYLHDNLFITQIFSQNDMILALSNASLGYAELSDFQISYYNLHLSFKDVLAYDILRPPIFYLFNSNFWKSLKGSEKTIVLKQLASTIAYANQLMVDKEKEYKDFWSADNK